MKTNQYKYRRNTRSITSFKRTLIAWGVIIVFGILLVRLWHSQSASSETPSYTEFYRDVTQNKVERVLLMGRKVKGTYIPSYKDGKQFSLIIPVSDGVLFDALRNNVSDFRVKYTGLVFSNIILFAIMLTLVIMAVRFFMFHQMNGAGRNLLGFAKSKARLMGRHRIKITFDDVAGIEEAKEELQEIIELLKDPDRFKKLGGRIPKGLLLIGPPGTGKTLLAKAVAGEANVPFYSISGSDFVELFVGVGASRVRDLFSRAKRNAPCIIFLDEIDAIGRYRSSRLNAGNEEREQTLNALLVEMDGFTTKEDIIVIAATNRPDVLDRALLRPGRFDRQIFVDMPDVNERNGILHVHTRSILLADNLDLKEIAKGTPGFSGADLANLANEAALQSARLGKDAVEMNDFEVARDKMKWGKERRSKVMTDDDRKITAYHEAGHALILSLLPDTEPLHKVTIIPRGVGFLGITMQLPKTDRYTKSKKQLIGEITGLMAGIAAEEIVFNDISTGASNDIQLATRLARLMVCEWGMSKKLGPIRYANTEQAVSCVNDDTYVKLAYSESVSQEIDEEVKKIMETAYNKAHQLLEQHKKTFFAVAEELLRNEVLDIQQINSIIDKAT
ncbi:MAG: ATP-dependent zinc metalloprotease FtsH [Candidatus Auribacterota bacterium]|jgi:cell division protease FtsH|nr:ATP-dependent zinc metalloprotease FtsH [Candidatus Auribacterota bacterium]